MQQSIVIASGKPVLIDGDAPASIFDRSWRICRDGYVRDSNDSAIHREIAGAPAGMVVDHINGDPLDNRRSNLRVCSQQQNLWNGSAHRDGSSGYRGVSRHRKGWRVQIQGKDIGFYADKHDAALAYNAEAIHRFGDFAKLNVVQRAGIEPARDRPGRF